MKPNEELRAVLDDIVPRYREKWGESDEWEGLVEFQRELGARAGARRRGQSRSAAAASASKTRSRATPSSTTRGAPRRIAVFGVKNVGPTIAAAGTPEQKVHLQRILSADEVWCQGFSEPDAGSDLAGLRCRADLHGDHFVVNGTKIWTSIGVWATHCMLLVRTDPEAPAAPRDLGAAGATRHAGHHAEPDRAGDRRALTSPSCVFEDVEVPVSALLGPMHQGWGVTMSTLGYERAGVIEVSGNLITEIERFLHGAADAGRLSARDRDRGAAIYTRARILGWLGERSLLDGGGGPNGGVAGLIKLAWSTLGQSFAEYAAEVDGLAAIAGDDMRSGQRLVGSRSYTIAGGTTEVMRNIIGERSLGLPREPKQ